MRLAILTIISGLSILYLVSTLFSEWIIQRGKTPLHKFANWSSYEVHARYVNRYNFLNGRHLYGYVNASKEGFDAFAKKIWPKFSVQSSINPRSFRLLSNPEAWMIDDLKLRLQYPIADWLKADFFQIKERLILSGTQPDFFIRNLTVANDNYSENLFEADIAHIDARRIFIVEGTFKRKGVPDLNFGELMIYLSESSEALNVEQSSKIEGLKDFENTTGLYCDIGPSYLSTTVLTQVNFPRINCR